ncbi:hypothetical protein BJY52DRAFT_1419836 [Lactarius psammicola]|nr:hypothetical protein BJY52DRAFT_1419836 [Lactarius psammicola]
MVFPQQPPPQNIGDDTAAPKEIISPEEITYSDPSGAIFSMYITRAMKFDKENVDNWDGQANGILLFTGLFSSTVATFIAISYQNLQQDPNTITQSLLVQISQQLSNATTGGISTAASTSTQIPFTPATSAVFINSVWFLSLVLSLTYRQIIQRNHAPHVRAHIREYFSRGARKFGIFGLAEMLPFLLLVSIFLFFAGLIVFAFLANHTVAYTTVAIVAFCIISYIVLTIMQFIFHDCPYYTPLTSILWFFAQVLPLSFFSVLYRGAKQSHDRWGTFSESAVNSFHRWHSDKAKSFSEGMISKLENSAKRISMDIYKKTLVWTLSQLDQDRELEEFVAEIPCLYESRAFSTHENDDVLPHIRSVLAVLPGPTDSHMPLPWSVIQLAQRAIASNLSKPIQQRRTQTCLRALYYIPGAIHDLLATYAAGKHYCLEILPLLNSPESLEIIEELWDTPNDDVALSVQCAAAVVAAFMITPPRRTLENFITPNVHFIGDDNDGKQFLDKRLRVGSDADGGGAPDYHPRSDSARLQNIMRFLVDIKEPLRYMNSQFWTSEYAESIRRERRGLYETRHTEEYRTGLGRFDQQGDRASPAFVPAAQQDLVTLTLEILARDPVANVAKPRSEAFRNAYIQFVQVALTQALEQARGQAQVMPGSLLETLARIQAQAADSFEMVKRTLEPVVESLRLQTVEIPTPNNNTSPPQMPVPSTEPAPAAPMARPDSVPVPAHTGSTQKLSPQPIDAMPSLPYSEASSSAWHREAAAGELGDSPV